MCVCVCVKGEGEGGNYRRSDLKLMHVGCQFVSLAHTSSLSLTIPPSSINCLTLHVPPFHTLPPLPPFLSSHLPLPLSLDHLPPSHSRVPPFLTILTSLPFQTPSPPPTLPFSSPFPPSPSLLITRFLYLSPSLSPSSYLSYPTYFPLPTSLIPSPSSHLPHPTSFTSSDLPHPISLIPPPSSHLPHPTFLTLAPRGRV